MTALNAMTRTYGYVQQDRSVPNEARKPSHGFITAEQFLRQRAVCVPLQIAAIHHCLQVPEWRRQHSLTETMIALLTLNKNRPKPMLKQRQTMEAV
jgi:hypothetical protein